MLLLFILRPFLEDLIGAGLLMDIFVSVILLAGIYAVSEKKHVFYISLIIASPALAVHWARYFVKVPFAFLVGHIFGALFYAFVAIVILNFLFREKVITGDMIIGAICVYLMIGMMWASIYSMLEILYPGSFQISEEIGSDLSHFSYFSFVTLSTLGYGDITPMTAPTRSLSVLEAITGQLYIAILVARLVGIHISQSMGKGTA
jgi:hypothetical protein